VNAATHGPKIPLAAHNPSDQRTGRYLPSPPDPRGDEIRLPTSTSGTDEPLAPVEHRGLGAVASSHLGGVGFRPGDCTPCTRRLTAHRPQRRCQASAAGRARKAEVPFGNMQHGRLVNRSRDLFSGTCSKIPRGRCGFERGPPWDRSVVRPWRPAARRVGAAKCGWGYWHWGRCFPNW
jgi:hypothetical protein